MAWQARASALAFEYGFAGGSVARGFLTQAGGPKALDERDHFPDFVIRGAYGRHFRAGDAVVDGGKQFGIGAAVAVYARGEIGAAASFAIRAWQ